MSSTDISTPVAIEPVRRPSRLRRAGLVAAGFLACALPAVWTISITRMLRTASSTSTASTSSPARGCCSPRSGSAAWSAAPRRLVRPPPVLGRRSAPPDLHGDRRRPRGRRPRRRCARPRRVVVVTGALLWLALPVRPRLRLPVQVDPLLTPLALVAAAVATPYVLDQVALQNAATGSPRAEPALLRHGLAGHILVVVGILGAVLPAVRRLGIVAGAGLAWTGAMGVLLGADRPWTVAMLVLGVAMTVAAARRGRH